METKTIATIAKILSIFTTLLLILGLIFADIHLFIIAMIMLIITLIPTFKYFDQLTDFFRKINGKVIDDERTQYIEAKSSVVSFATVLGVSIYSTAAIFTLRNIHPQYTDLAYPFLIIIVIGSIVYMISNFYYKRKFSD